MQMQRLRAEGRVAEANLWFARSPLICDRYTAGSRTVHQFVARIGAQLPGYTRRHTLHTDSNWRGRVTPTTRERVMDVIKSLPADTSVEEAMERLYFLADIEEGLRQVEQGQVISHEEAKRRLLGRP